MSSVNFKVSFWEFFGVELGKICLYFQLEKVLIPDPNKEGK